MKTFFETIGVSVPDIYLPHADIDWEKRSVVACDQYTSQPEYRQTVSSKVGDAPSTLNMIFPEVYLEDGDSDERIERIKKTMIEYINNDIVKSRGYGFMYVDRKTSHVDSRKGLIMALDLEKYEYHKGSQTLIRATEGTIVDRLPPRIKVREGAPFELPHIMVLIDDPEKQVIEPISAQLDKCEKLYDFDLMMDGGHISGYHITDESMIAQIISGLEHLADTQVFRNKYNVGDDKGVLLFAMGDGNHSFATAKAIWEKKKKTLSAQEQLRHPARFALVEINNVHDEGITFEPIHRVLFNIDYNQLLDEMKQHFHELGSQLEITSYDSQESLLAQLPSSTSQTHYCRGVHADGYFMLAIHQPKLNLEVGNIQAFLDDYLARYSHSKIDYVHGDDVTVELGQKEGNIGFLFPIMSKSDFFKTVVVDGALPRKTFSMGEAEEKRFYLEAKRI